MSKKYFVVIIYDDDGSDDDDCHSKSLGYISLIENYIQTIYKDFPEEYFHKFER